MNIQPISKSNSGPLLILVMPNSSYLGGPGDFLGPSKKVAESSTTGGRVWYGTARPGDYIEQRTKALYFLESFATDTFLTDVVSAVTNQYSEYQKAITEIDMLVRNGQFNKARELFKSLPEVRRASKHAKELARALRLPSGRLLAHGTGRRPNSKWLALNRNRFDGKWVALEDNELIDSDTSYKKLRLKIQGLRNSLHGIQFVRMG